MSEVTVSQLAQVLGMTADKLLQQFAEAGIAVSKPDQAVSSAEKLKLLGFLRSHHGKQEAAAPGAGAMAAPRQITLRRKQVAEITVSSGAAKGKTVAVEVRQKRTYLKRADAEVPGSDADPSLDAERERARQLLAESRAKNQAEDQRLREIENRRRAEDAARKQAEAELAERERQAQAATVVETAEGEAEPEQETAAALPVARKPEPKKAEPRKPAPGPARHGDRGPAKKSDADAPHRHKGNRGSHMAPISAAVDDEVGAAHFVSGQLHLSGDSAARRQKKKVKPRGDDRSRGGSGAIGSFSRPTASVVREVAVGDSITVTELANKLAIKGAVVVKTLFKMGTMVTINEVIDHDTAVLVAEELGHKVQRAQDNDAEAVMVAAHAEDQGARTPRPPVVTI
ncbi:MAG: translation initiation factor IF-2 N-terminal domain-containing protein, partial [Lysobacterales bacterium]